MNLPYFFRLLVLCGASYFLIHSAFAALAYLFAGRAIRLADQMKPRISARLLLLVRVLPMIATLVVLFGFCIPSYLWLEPSAGAEEVGIACVIAACLGILTWLLSARRVAAALAGTARYIRRCHHDGHEATLPGDSSPVLVLEADAPVLAMAGVIHPQLVVSRRVVIALSPDQRDAAFRHERAHQVSRDNFKRLLMLLAPDVLPFFKGFSELEKSWAKFTEWAADDYAAAGDHHRALSLASALVTVARMSSPQKLPTLTASLMADDRDLSERVDRLLQTQPPAQKSMRSVLPFIGGASAFLASAAGLALVWPASLSLVHNVLERLIR